MNYKDDELNGTSKIVFYIFAIGLIVEALIILSGYSVFNNIP